MENPSDDEAETPRYTLVTGEGTKQHSSREYTGVGRATYYFDEGKREEFEGHYLNGVREGKGSYRYANGDSYEGDFQLNKKHGIGTARYKEQPPEDTEEDPALNESVQERFSTYLGHFREGKRDESGAIVYANGDVYIGGWSNGKKSGFGKYRFAADKSQLVGYWQQGRMQYGRWNLPSGIYYAGSFKRNKPWGKGVWVFPRSGNQVIGEYIQKVKDAAEEPAEEGQEPGEESLPPDELLEIESVEFMCRQCTSLRE
ncbi:MORN repeat-containing protein [Toxoplasma gondii MAS]|uniref:MORN repeat-containing protein n=2 Tax=Toxoplasma gondii TaxID=5811 RepID=A0A086QQJ2_TOXGO|nr:MORN repeat-containing protein [Toxoplasma gondii MAS]